MNGNENDKNTAAGSKTLRGVSLRALEAAARPGDTIAESSLIAREPGTRIGVAGLTYERCRFIRCRPADGDEALDCTFSDAPLPPDPPPVEMTEIDAAQLASLRADRAELERLKKEAARG